VKKREDIIHTVSVLGFVALMAVTLFLARKVVTAAVPAATEDTEFVYKAASGGLGEVKLGQLATAKASSADVKAFGQRMVTDHSKANAELKSLATRLNITVPDALSKTDQDLYDRLSALSGAEFDKAYAAEMVKDHEQDVAEFERFSQDGKDASLRDFAAKTLPTLQSHLRQAKQMQNAVQASAPPAPMPR
jgi:putative membrane protein